MATTQLPVQGVFDKETGSLLGFAVPGGSTVSANGLTGLAAFKDRLIHMHARRKRKLWDRWQPLVAPAAWQAGILYPAGVVVESGGHWYQQMRRTVTANSANAPTGTQYLAVLDGNNGPAWQWIGNAKTTASLGYPVTYTAPQATLPAYAASNRSISGWDSTGAQFGTVYRPWANIYQRAGKGEPVAGAHRSSTTDITQYFLVPTANGRDYYTDSSFFVFRNNACTALLIDDVPVTLGHFSAGAGNPNYFHGVDFGFRALRKITMISTGTPSNIYVDERATFFAPTKDFPEATLRGLHFGDSWTYGVGDMGVLPYQGYAPALYEALGAEDVGIFQLGGTGVWKQNNTVTGPNYLDRFRYGRDRLDFYKPTDGVNFFHIQGSVNDSVTGAANPTGDVNLAPTSAQLTAQTLTMMQEVRGSFPDATILLSAIQFYGTQSATTNLAYKAAFDQFAATDSNCLWVDASATGVSGEATLNVRNTPNGSSPPTSGQETHIGYYDNTTSTTMLNQTHPTVHGNLVMASTLANQIYRAVGLPLRVE